MLDRNRTVADTVLDHSECAPVFQHHRIDFCCGGDLSIEAAAKAKGVEVDALMAALTRAIDERSEQVGDDPRALDTPQLIERIVAKHHQYLRKALPFVQMLAAKVARVHGDHNPKLRELDVAVRELADALGPHLDEEEQQLFPALIGRAQDRPKVATLLGSMHQDHLAVAALLERVRAAGDDFTLPPWACNSYRALFSELAQLEGDVFTHVHLENHVLRPRFSA
ncbi:MAG: iron-sulfur cluster repair di-iron protein [Deltaproteobacteria bacterium RBG_16_71_12]|nr:MAG: iron-sulfur cluster repair di-iron protein [Deltaproteobacteria bacterium RBG_16_71_12]